jgi:acetyl-CoA carboxylase biotin carboxyl carrier protein
MVKSNMAGTVWKILVKPGDTVEAGQDVLILESMKMEIPISSEAAGTVKSVNVKEGDFVNDGDVVAELA